MVVHEYRDGGMGVHDAQGRFVGKYDSEGRLAGEGPWRRESAAGVYFSILGLRPRMLK